MRTLSYAQALREGHAQLLESDPRVFLIGQGLWSPWYAGASLDGLDQEFGTDRLIDSPVCENATTAAAVGAALAGMRPIVFHPRMDFMLLATDPIVNQAANWSYLFAGAAGVPVVIRATVNRGGEQGAQHSQALQAMFCHVPGLKVVMPSTPYDAKGLLVAAVNDGNPVLYIDDRWLYDTQGPVPEECYSVDIGSADRVSVGSDITIVATSYMLAEAQRAAEQLAQESVSVELINLRSLKPWDVEMVCASTRKTGRLLVADGGWRSFGVTAEISATVTEKLFTELKVPVGRVALPDTPAPTSASLEAGYFPTADDIIQTVKGMLR
jgi:acetoin:2,6-dichlorophenolindophenol oxidoreductase subunit beta